MPVPFSNLGAMPCTGKTLSLTNISCLDFKLDWDISGATPTVKVTNNSTVVDATKLKWWFFITSPSGVSIYGIDVNTGTPPTPDFNLVAWTTKTFVLPTPFNPGACGQVEFSPSAPYTVTVFVQDITGVVTPIDSYSKNTIIVRPNGNSTGMCGNFGKASVNIKVDCAEKNVMCFDGTKMIYNNILTPLTTSRKWTMVYPMDDAGDIPNMTSTEANVNFPASTNSKGYMIYLQLYATYDYGNNITVKVQYKLYDKSGELGEKFAVNCNTNLCLLQCQMKKFYELSKKDCGTVENAALTQRMVRLQWLFSQILTGIFQPLCGIDVPGLITEMQTEMGYADGCDCGCDEGNSNFGFSNPSGGGGGSSTSTCCPVVAPVNDINTGGVPAVCPGSFFPAAVYSPDGSTVIGMATSADSMVSIINANAAWNVYGTAFNQGNCQVGFYLNPGITSVPPVIINPGTVINVVDQATGVQPAACPASYFPVTVYAPDGTTPIGTAANITQLITIVNSNAAWQAYGTAFYNSSYCTVAFIPAAGVPPGTIPPIIVSGTTGCVGGIQHYTANVQDICGQDIPPITSLSFPLNAWVDFGSGLVALGSIADNAAFIAALNAATGKPASVTFSTGTTGGVLNYTIDNTNCAGYSGVVQIYTDSNAGTYMLYGANHKTVALPQLNVAGVYGVGIKTMAIIGRIAGLQTDEYWWHVTRVQSNYLVVTNADQGRVYCFDITNPLNPTLFGMVQLNDTGSGNCFQGIPQQWGVDMNYGLYFPTDYHNMNLREIYVCESSTGSIWHVDFMGVPLVVKSFADQRLVAQCPRVHTKGELWFSTDGSYQAITGPGEPTGEVIRFAASATVWNGGSISSVTIFPNFVEEVWAASFDAANWIIYFSGNRGSIAAYDVSISSLVGSYANVMGQRPTDRLNTKFYANKLYHSSYGAYNTPGGLNTATRFIDTTTLGTTNVITNFQSFLSNNRTHWNFMPLGNCNGVLTFENGANGAGFALFKLDGTYIGLIPFVAGAAYNVVAIPGVGVYTPNTLV
jgi:hypothetical protein